MGYRSSCKPKFSTLWLQGPKCVVGRQHLFAEVANEVVMTRAVANGLDGGAQVRDAPDQPPVEREEFIQRGIVSVCGPGHLLAFHSNLSPMITIMEPTKKAARAVP